jgi:hypothetical protein
MKIDIKDCALQIDIPSLLESLSGEALHTLIASLACQEEVIRRVSEQILHGVTEDGWGGLVGGVEYRYPNAIMTARRYLAMNASEVAAREIKLMQEGIDRLNSRIDSLQSELANRRPL